MENKIETVKTAETVKTEMKGVFEVEYVCLGFTVHGCPLDVKISTTVGPAVTVDFSGDQSTLQLSYELHRAFTSWIRGEIMSEAVYDWFNEELGFAPFFRMEKDRKLWYVPTADFMSKEIMRGRRKPMATQKFMGVENFPKALLLQMQVVTGLLDSAVDAPVIPETVDTGDLDPCTVAKIKPALEALLPDVRARGSVMKPEFLVIYEWFGLNRMLEDSDTELIPASLNTMYFIDGDRLRVASDVNLAEAGQLWDYTPVKLLPQLFEFGHIHSTTGWEDVSDNMIIEYRLWERENLLVFEPDLKVSPIQARFMQLLLRKNGYLN